MGGYVVRGLFPWLCVLVLCLPIDHLLANAPQQDQSVSLISTTPQSRSAAARSLAVPANDAAGYSVSLIAADLHNVNDVALQGNYLYCATQMGVQVIDVTSSLSPQLVGSCMLPSRGYRIAVSGGLAYVVSSESSELYVTSIVDPELPILIGSCDFSPGGGGRGVAVSGNHVYVASSNGELEVFDVGDSTKPTLLASVATPAPAYGVFVDGNRAYISDSMGFRIVDVSNPVVPVLVGGCNTGGYPGDLVVVNDTVYLANLTIGLQIYNATSPNTPQLLGTFHTTNYSYTVAIQGKLAFVSDYNLGLQAVDVTDPSNPVLKGSYKTIGSAYGIAVQDSLVYEADGYARVEILGISDQGAPYSKGRYENLVDYSRVVLTADYIYGIDYYGLQVSAVPAVGTAINPLGKYHTSGRPLGLTVRGTTAYVVDESAGLSIIDVQNPSSPQLVGTYHTAGRATALALEGDYVYVCDSLVGLRIVNISNAGSPQLVGTYTSTNGAWGVAVQNGYAYVVNGSGVEVVDITVPSSPVLVGTFSAGTSVFRPCITVEGSYLYFGCYNAQLKIIDVSNPHVPTLASSLSFSGTVSDIQVAYKHLFIAEQMAGLEIYNVENPETPTFAGRYGNGYSNFDMLVSSVSVHGKHALLAELRGAFLLSLDCSDADSDGFCDDVDNCPTVANADQLDSNHDGVGDVCEYFGNHLWSMPGRDTVQVGRSAAFRIVGRYRESIDSMIIGLGLSLPLNDTVDFMRLDSISYSGSILNSFLASSNTCVDSSYFKDTVFVSVKASTGFPADSGLLFTVWTTPLVAGFYPLEIVPGFVGGNHCTASDSTALFKGLVRHLPHITCSNAVVLPHSPVILRVPSEYATVQLAIDASWHGDSILVAPGTYTGPGNRDIDLLGKRIIVTSHAGAGVTIIDCQADTLNPHRGFYLHSGEDSSTVISGFTIQHAAIGAWDGGGIMCEGSSPSILNCVVRYCTTSAGGVGAALACESSSKARIVNCEFYENTASWGGAAFVYNASPTFRNCVFRRNTSRDDGSQASLGGAICIWHDIPGQNDVTTIDSSTFSANTCSSPYLAYGGAICDYPSIAGISPKLNITNSVIDSNKVVGLPGSSAVRGGAVCAFRDSVIIRGSTFRGNEATAANLISNAGAIYWNSVSGPGILSIDSCIVVSNRCENIGGGVRSGTGQTTVSRSTISGNSAGTSGGGISTAGSLHLDHSIISYSQDGEGVYAPSSSVTGLNSSIAAAQEDLMVPVLTYRHSGLSRNEHLAVQRSANQSAVAATTLEIVATDIFGNFDGDWVGGLATQKGMNGNMSFNPKFCDTAAADFGLDSLSPCAPLSPLNASQSLIGALGPVCRVCSDADHNGICDDQYAEDCNCTVTLTTPAAGDSLTSLAGFAWGSQCESYLNRVVLATDSLLTQTVWTADVNEPTALYTGPVLETNRKYYWSVAFNCGGVWTPFVASQYFSIRPPADSLAAPSLISPAVNDTIALPFTFSWSTVPRAQQYLLEIGRPPTFDTVLASMFSSVTSLSVPQLSSLPIGSMAFWRVAAIDSLNFVGRWSTGRSFVVKAAVSAPSTPITYMPDTTIADSVTYRWSRMPGTNCYEVEFSRDSMFTSPASAWTKQVCSGDTTATTTRPDTSVFWRVRACNSMGCSPWGVGMGISGVSGGPCCGGGPSTPHCIAAPIINVSGDTLFVEQGASFSLTASLAVSCVEHVWGGWYLNDSLISSFDLGNIGNTITTLVSPQLPTTTVGSYQITVRAHAGATLEISGAKNIVVTFPSYGTASSLLITASQTSLSSDGLSVSQLSVEVVDDLGRRVRSDQGRTINLTLSGPGTLNSSSDTSGGGMVEFTYTAGTTVGTALLIAGSSGLTPDSVTIYLSQNPLVQMKETFTQQMAVLDSLRLHELPGKPLLFNQYATFALWSFYDSHVRVASPSPSDTTAFRRLVLSLNVVLQNYYHAGQPLYPQDNDFAEAYGQEWTWNDAIEGLQEFTTPVLSAAVIGYNTVPSLPAAMQPIANTNLGRICTRLSESISKVAVGLPWFSKSVLQDAGDYVRISTKDSLDAGLSSVAALSNTGIRTNASQLALSYYTFYSQPMIDSVASWTVENQTSGDAQSAARVVDSLLLLLQGSGSVAQQQFQQLWLSTASIDYLSSLQNLPANAIDRLFAVTNVANAVLADTSYTSGLNILGGYSGRLFGDQLTFSQKAFRPDLGSMKVGRTSTNASVGTPTESEYALYPANQSLLQAAARVATEATDVYETQLRAILDQLQGGNYAGLTASLHSLAAKNAELASMLRGNMAIVQSSAVSARYLVSGFDKLYAGLYADYLSSGTSRDLFDFWGAYFDYDRSNATTRLSALSNGNLAVTQIQNLQKRFDDLFSRIYTVAAVPSLVVVSTSLPPGSLTANVSYPVQVRVKNNGAGTGQSCFVRVAGDARLTALAPDSVFVGPIASGDSVTVPFQIKFKQLAQDAGKSGSWAGMTVIPGTSNGIASSYASTISYSFGCCLGTTGNVNGSGIVDLADLSALVSYLTGGGYVLPCVPEANVNTTGIVDLADLSALVSYLTGGGYVPPSCP
jgi:hypothetical protein